MSLLDQAKKLRVHKNGAKDWYNLEEIELISAWAKGEIKSVQVQKVLKFSGSSQMYEYISHCFKFMMQKGLIEVVNNHPDNVTKDLFGFIQENNQKNNRDYKPTTFKDGRVCLNCKDPISDQTHKLQIFCSKHCNYVYRRHASK